MNFSSSLASLWKWGVRRTAPRWRGEKWSGEESRRDERGEEESRAEGTLAGWLADSLLFGPPSVSPLSLPPLPLSHSLPLSFTWLVPIHPSFFSYPIPNIFIYFILSIYSLLSLLFQLSLFFSSWRFVFIPLDFMIFPLYFSNNVLLSFPLFFFIFLCLLSLPPPSLLYFHYYLLCSVLCFS